MNAQRPERSRAPGVPCFGGLPLVLGVVERMGVDPCVQVTHHELITALGGVQDHPRAPATGDALNWSISSAGGTFTGACTAGQRFVTAGRSGTL